MILYASNLGSSLTGLYKGEEALKILLPAWEQAAKQQWPGEFTRLRADLAGRICSAYHYLHMQQPDVVRDNAARVWVVRAAEHCPLEKFSSETEFNFATMFWMAWLAQLADEGNSDGYKQQRTLLLQKARGMTTPNTLERIAKATLLLPIEGAELKQVIEGAAKAFQSNPNDEWLRLAQCLALLRTGKAQECLTTAQPMLKSTDGSRYCCIQPIAALAYRQLGQHAEADAIIAALDKDANRSKHISSPTQRDGIIARVLLNEARKK